MASNVPKPQPQPLNGGLDRIRSRKVNVIEEMKTANTQLAKFIDNQKIKMIHHTDSYHEYESKITEEKAKYESLSKTSNEIYNKLQLEKNLLSSAIAHQEKTNNEMEALVFQRLPKEFANIEFLYKKETEIHQKIKKDNSINAHQGELIADIKETVDLYKEAAGIELSKTPEGWLKIVLMKGIRNEIIKEDICIVIEMKQGKYRITQMTPRFPYQKYEDELNKTQNFSLFLCKVIVNEYSQLLMKGNSNNNSQYIQKPITSYIA